MSTQVPSPPSSSPQSQQQHWWSKHRIAIAMMVIAAVAALGAVLEGTGNWRPFTASPTASPPQPANGGNCNVQANGSGGGNTVICAFPTQAAPTLDDKSQAADEQFAKTIVRDVTPAGSGPWPFLVLKDLGYGLKVRSSPDKDGYQIGWAEHRAGVWVQCYRDSEFDPDPSSGGGTRWYKVRWPNATQSSGIYVSGPSDPAQGWAYAFYLTPNGTNGNVPRCSP